MNTKLTIASLLLLVTPGCGNTASNSPSGTILVQLLIDAAALSQVKKQITPLINAIIKAELGLSATDDFQFFSPKERQALTLYYIEGVSEQTRPLLLSKFDQIYHACAVYRPHKLRFAQIDFFAGPFNVDDELIIRIEDSEGTLTHLNQEIRSILHKAHEDYLHEHNKDLYTISTSERFSYIAHIGLGRVRSNSIKERMKDLSRFDQLFKHLQT
jgi:hypothetical protein